MVVVISFIAGKIKANRNETQLFPSGLLNFNIGLQKYGADTILQIPQPLYLLFQENVCHFVVNCRILTGS
jgi:hypothetical protein